MIRSTPHSFHIPVMGLGFTIDTPIKVAHFGISSVISIVDDGLIEQMRVFYCQTKGIPYSEIPQSEHDHRAKRITAYLNLVDEIVAENLTATRNAPFEPGSLIEKYFRLLPAGSFPKQAYQNMMNLPEGPFKTAAQTQLRQWVSPGAADVNIMAKVDKTNTDTEGNPLPNGFSDALAALRGFANSTSTASIVFSAGYNPRLYNYVDQFPDFFPGPDGTAKKKVILKVSDYRSALTQGKILAKKGIWTSEFRIESGLNCGGHAFATDGLLLGPIMEEFKNNRSALAEELFLICNQALTAKGMPIYPSVPQLQITVQGGIGTHAEDTFLREYYGADSTGWGSPFLLVPETTAVDEGTLNALANARPEDYYLSDISPLGVPFNSFRGATSETQKAQRIAMGRPGSPCTKKYLVSSTEFGTSPICTASRKYQHLKLAQAKESPCCDDSLCNGIIQKDCLCEGLSAAPLLKNGLKPLYSNGSKAVAICPGPNLAYFSGVFSLLEMTGHIYGTQNLLNQVPRPHVFVNELKLYVDYFEKETRSAGLSPAPAKTRQLKTFQQNLLKGIGYYESLTEKMNAETPTAIESFKADLNLYKDIVAELWMPAETRAIAYAS